MTANRTDIAARYIAGTRERALPPDILDEAKKALVDWTAVCIAARNAPEAQGIARVAQSWGSRGNAGMLTGGRAAASVAALVNGTLSHCLDYDDTHIPSCIHIGGPTWATALAAGAANGADETLVLQAFVAGFEVSARLGDHGVGIRLNDSGWHATPTLGKLGAAATAAVLYGLDEARTRHALGIAGTQAGGLTASFGTMAKPFHLGKTAMDAILAAELAAQGFTASADVLDPSRGLVATLLQEAQADAPPLAFGDTWEIRNNSFKPYAACQLTHAAIDAARAARPRVGTRRLARMKATVHPLAIKIAGVRDPATPTQGKFSLGFCIALGLRGHAVTTLDFHAGTLGDTALRDLCGKVELAADERVARTATRLEIWMDDGECIVENIEHAFGSVGNPMGWPELDAKFVALAEPVIGAQAPALLAVLRDFERPGSLERLFALGQGG